MSISHVDRKNSRFNWFVKNHNEISDYKSDFKTKAKYPSRGWILNINKLTRKSSFNKLYQSFHMNSMVLLTKCWIKEKSKFINKKLLYVKILSEFVKVFNEAITLLIKEQSTLILQIKTNWLFYNLLESSKKRRFEQMERDSQREEEKT